MSRKGVRRKWINPTLTGTGPAWRGYCGLQTRWTCSCGVKKLMKQKQMSKRGLMIWILSCELPKKERRKWQTSHWQFFLCCWFMFDWKRVDKTLSVLNIKNWPKQKELCSKKYKNNHSATKYCRFAKHSHQHNPIIVAGHGVTTDVATNTKERKQSK